MEKKEYVHFANQDRMIFVFIFLFVPIFCTFLIVRSIEINSVDGQKRLREEERWEMIKPSQPTEDWLRSNAEVEAKAKLWREAQAEDQKRIEKAKAKDKERLERERKIAEDFFRTMKSDYVVPR
jgi:hypothetical protein